MSEVITITNITANTPVDIYYCDSTSGSCVFVSTVATFPYQFSVPPPYDENNILVKIVDTEGCIYGEFIYITPTPTPSNTATNTPTPTNTQTPSQTNSSTPTVTPTTTVTPTNSPTITPTPSTTPIIFGHFYGQNVFSSFSGETNCISGPCNDMLSLGQLYTYLSDGYLEPTLGIIVYQYFFDDVLYVPYNGNNSWILMSWQNGTYAVKISSTGVILDFILCDLNPSSTPTPTFTSTPTNTNTPTPSVTENLTPTATETPTSTPTQTPSNTNTPTNTSTQTQTPTPTITPTSTSTQTPSNTNTPTNTSTQTQTPTKTPTQTPTPTRSYNSATVYFGYSDGSTCTSSSVGTLYWSPNLPFDTGTPLFVDSALTSCWTNIGGFNVISLGSGSYEFYTFAVGFCYEVGANNGIQC